MMHLTLKLSIRDAGGLARSRIMPPAQHSAGTVGKMLGMEEERTESASGDLAGVPTDIPGDSGWIKTRVAAEALGVDPRTVRAYIERGDLVARSEGEGIQKTYLVSIDSVYALRDRRGGASGKPRRGREKSAKSDVTTGLPGNAAEKLTGIIRDLTADLVRKSASESELRTRLELTAQAESTLREDLARERDRAKAERERADRLEAELREARSPLAAPRDEPETAAETTEGADTPADREQADTGVQQASPRSRSWWRRFFGFE